MPLCPFATYRGPVPNVGGPIGTTRLGVCHVMAGTLDGTDSWFHNPSAQVSAHFGNGKDGRLYQWVPVDQVAWAEADYNGVSISIENEGQSGDLLTTEQSANLTRLLPWIEANCSVPIIRQHDPDGTGWIGHGELGVAGGNHPDCPGDPILNGLTVVIDALNSSPPPPPPQPPTPKDYNMITRDPLTGGYWVARPNGTTYAFGGAPYLGPAQKYLTDWGIGTPTNPIVGITSDNAGGFVLAADTDDSPGIPALYHIDVSGQFKV